MAFKKQTCCFTGHRKIPPEQYASIVKRLESVLVDLIYNGYKYFGAGGALGFDTIAAQTILDLKAQYPQIKLILILPCITQANSRNQQDKEVYEQIKIASDKVVYTSQEYTKGCMFKRNRHLVDNSSVCIAYLTRNQRRTAYTVNNEIQKNIKVINISEELKWINQRHKKYLKR